MRPLADNLQDKAPLLHSPPTAETEVGRWAPASPASVSHPPCEDQLTGVSPLKLLLISWPLCLPLMLFLPLISPLSPSVHHDLSWATVLCLSYSSLFISNLLLWKISNLQQTGNSCTKNPLFPPPGLHNSCVTIFS